VSQQTDAGHSAFVSSLSQLLAEAAVLDVRGSLDREIASITHDSRRARPGTLFVAYVGVNRDVHDFLPDAAQRGAHACLVERELDDLARAGLLVDGPTYVRVSDARRARAEVAASLYGHPARRMTMVGVTGTDGKTTTCTLIESMLLAAGRTTGVVTTVGARFAGTEHETGLHVTTPEPEELQAYLAEMAASAVEIAIVETTSHGLAQHRVGAVDFDVAVLTNITPEALEYHGSFDAYVAAKALLIESLLSGRRVHGQAKTAVLNRDDPSFARLASIPVERLVTYGTGDDADFRLISAHSDAGGLDITADTPAGQMRLRSPLLGVFNVANIMASCGAAYALGCGPDAWLAGASAVGGVPGRMERVDAGQAFLALVDFAHTPNGLAAALESARLLAGSGRVIAVFGCAGLRDTDKRPAMGEVAARLADYFVLTAEDPRTEDLALILDQIASGASKAGALEGRQFQKVPDRMEALRAAASAARPGDVVIVCGKGHEQSMAFGDAEYPWDDRLALRAALTGAAYGELPTRATGRRRARSRA
jgi:UDP-N-acetylmuramoyl-L-alanyl-D-glutamate--2,6-diaminopimelate ligase